MFSFHSHYFNKLPVTFFCPKSLSQPLFIRTNPFLPPASVNKHWISHIIISEPRYVPNQSRWQFCSCKYSTNLLNEHTLLRSNVSGHVPFYRPAASEHRPPPPPTSLSNYQSRLRPPPVLHCTLLNSIHTCEQRLFTHIRYITCTNNVFPPWRPQAFDAQLWKVLFTHDNNYHIP